MIDDERDVREDGLDAELPRSETDADAPDGAEQGIPAQPTAESSPAGETPGGMDAAPAFQRWFVPLMAVLAMAAAGAAFWAAKQVNERTAVSRVDLSAADTSPFEGFAVEPPQPAPDIALTDHNGKSFQLADAEGKAVLVFFGYTHCPDVCPTTLLNLAAALKELGPTADDVQILFVTVDPERDSADVLKQYVTGYDQRILGLTGSLDEIQKVADGFGVQFWKDVPEGQPAPVDNYTMTHSARVFLIDPEGMMRVSFSGPYTPDQVAHDVRVVMQPGA